MKIEKKNVIIGEKIPT